MANKILVIGLDGATFDGCRLPVFSKPKLRYIVTTLIATTFRN